MYNLYAQFPRQQICRDRQYAALLRWAAYIEALPPPTGKPSEDWVAQSITASRIPQQTDMYVNLTLAYVLEDPNIQINIRQHLSAFNDEAVEASMDAQVDAALAGKMAAFCRTQVTQQAIDQWYLDHGYAEVAAAAQTGFRTPSGPLNTPMN